MEEDGGGGGGGGGDVESRAPKGTPISLRQYLYVLYRICMHTQLHAYAAISGSRHTT